MTQLPNSIERCAPLLGFDPYAFIMDKPSNLLPGSTNAPGVKNTDSFNKNQAAQNNKKAPKTGKLLKGAKYAAAAFSLAVIAAGALKCTNGVRKVFKKPPIGLPKAFHTVGDAAKKYVIYPVQNFVIDILNKIRKP